jgi:hypothetical protein
MYRPVLLAALMHSTAFIRLLTVASPNRIKTQRVVAVAQSAQPQGSLGAGAVVVHNVGKACVTVLLMVLCVIDTHAIMLFGFCLQLLNSVAPPEDTEAAVPHAIKSHPKHFQLQVALGLCAVII